MKKIFLIIFGMLTFSSLISFSQNLVPNFSFEQTDTCDIYGPCPTGFSMICIAEGWSTAKGSPDYFNACNSDTVSISSVSVPLNFGGYQNAATGNAYAGFFTHLGYNPNNYNEREWIKCNLNSPLITGNKYYISFKISLADSVNCSTNNIGILFSTVPFWHDVSVPLNNFTHSNTQLIIEDTSNWTTIEEEFIADSAYEYMIIGNFYADSLTDSIYYPNRPVSYWVDSSQCVAYYYIDDISVVADSTVDLTEDELKFNIEILPNPAIEKIFIDFPHNHKANVKIFNLLGTLFFEENFLERNISIDLSFYQNGIYLIQAQQENNFLNKKITLIK